MIIKLNEDNSLAESLAVSTKVHEVSVDGLPEDNRTFIAFLTSKASKYVLAHKVRNNLAQESSSDHELSVSMQNALFVEEANNKVHSMKFERYIYVDELNLIPQSYIDTTAALNKARDESKAKITAELIQVFGKEYGTILADKHIIARSTGYAELVGHDRYLLRAPGYTSGVRDVYDILKQDFGEVIAKDLFFKIPYVADAVNSNQVNIYVKVPEDRLQSIKNRPFEWLLNWGFVWTIDTYEDQPTLVCSTISTKYNMSRLRSYLKYTEGLTF